MPPEEEEEMAPGTLGTEIETLDPLQLAAWPFKADTSAVNGSSIGLLAEFEGRGLLLGGDAADTSGRVQ